MHIKFCETADIEKLRGLAQRYLQKAKEKDWPRLDECKTAEEAQAYVLQWANEKKIPIIFVPDLPPDTTAMLTNVAPGENDMGNLAEHTILVSDRLLDLPDGVVRKRAIRSAVMHEFCHVVLEHAGQKAQENTCTRRNPDEDRAAELLMCAVAFMPHDTFEQRIRQGDGNVQLRLVANEYRMSVDCLLKWISIVYVDQFVSHYFKCNVSDERRIEDYLFRREGIQGLFFKPQVFDPQVDFSLDSHQGSAGRCVSKAIVEKADQPPTAFSADDRDYWCYAFYEPAAHNVSRKDKVTVLGFDQSDYRNFMGGVNNRRARAFDTSELGTGRHTKASK